MKGWFYKELRQNRFGIIAVVVFGMYPLMNIFCLEHILRDVESMDSFRTFEPLYVIFSVAFMNVTFMKMDDKEVWGYFVTSTPLGYRGYLFVKYLIIFIITILHFITALISDALFRNIEASRGYTGFTVMPWLFIGYFCLQLLCCAVEFPLTVRMGARNASAVMLASCMVLFVGLTAVMIVISNITPIEMIGKVREYEIPLVLKLSGILLSVLLYWDSYFLSCSLYLKGVKYCR